MEENGPSGTGLRTTRSERVVQPTQTVLEAQNSATQVAKERQSKQTSIFFFQPSSSSSTIEKPRLLAYSATKRDNRELMARKAFEGYNHVIFLTTVVLLLL